jgi:hypothetical protein
MIARRIFCLKETPSGPWEPHVHHSWTLNQGENGYELMIEARLGRSKRKRRVQLKDRNALKWITALQQVRVSFPPMGHSTCDGSYYELTCGDEQASISLTWLNFAPEGAEILDDLVERLWFLVTRDLEFPGAQPDDLHLIPRIA